MRVLVVEDEPILCEGIKVFLEHNGLNVTTAASGDAGMQMLSGSRFDACVLDLSLPNVDGLRVLIHARAHDVQTPVLILSRRDAVSEKVKAFEAGADDYVTKPVELEELLARVQALLRRTHSVSGSPTPDGSLELDFRQRTAILRGQRIDLSEREFDVLRFLVAHSGRVVRREQIRTFIYRSGEDASSNAIDVHVHSLRKKLGRDLIQTVRGVGYIVDFGSRAD